MNRAIIWADESSLSLWNPIKTKTFSNGEVTLPMQAKRGPNRTIYGAMAGVD